MATAAPHVKLLRQLATAKDDYQSGAFDIAWEGGSATIFLVFGQPSHAVLQSGDRRLEGQAALDALPIEMPVQFAVGDWRRAMTPVETLDLTMDDLTETFAQLAGDRSESADADALLTWLSADDDSPDLGFALGDFPLLPAGPELWPEAEASDVGLARRLAALPTALVVLAGQRLRAAGVVHGGELIDAVWVDTEDHARGDTAVIAVLGAQQGKLSGYALDGADVAEALPMLWRYPVATRVDAAWLDARAMVAALQADGTNRAVLIDGPSRGVGLINRGKVVAVYSAEHRTPARSADALVALLAQPAATVRVLQRAGTAVSQRPDGAAPASEAHAAANGSDPFWSIDDADDDGWFVDYDQVKRELVQIGHSWLGDRDSAPVTEVIERARPTIDDFVAAIDTIRTLNVSGHDPASVHGMAREMHQHAAERLCGA